jgi:hypothetical protein
MGLSDKPEYDLAVGQRTFRVRDLSSETSFEICRGGDDDIFLICKGSSRLYAVTTEEAETLANDILRMVERIRSGESQHYRPENT